MKPLNFFIFFTIFLMNMNCSEKTANHEFFSKKYQWKIEIPQGFEKVNSTELEQFKEKGVRLLRENGHIDFENTSTFLFSYKKGEFSKIMVKTNPFDTLVYGSYDQKFSEFKEIMYYNFSKNINEKEIDTLSHKEIIGGKEFNLFKTNIQLENNIELVTLWYSRLINGHDFVINIGYINPEDGNLMIDAIKSSKFMN